MQNIPNDEHRSWDSKSFCALFRMVEIRSYKDGKYGG